MFAFLLFAPPFLARAQAPIQALQVGYCFGAYSESVRYLEAIEIGAKEPYLSKMQQSQSLIERDKKTFLAYLLSENGFQNYGVLVAIGDGKSDVDNLGAIALSADTYDKISEKYGDCKILLTELPF